MKLVHVATSDRFWPFLYGQVDCMKQRGLEIHAISSPGPGLDQFAAGRGVRAASIPMSRGITPVADLAALWRLWRLFRTLRPEIVHAHTPKAGLLAMLAAFAARVRVRIYTIHGLVWQSRSGSSRRLLIVLERLACRLAHRVLVVSESVRHSALADGLANPKKLILAGHGSANGLDFEKFDPHRMDPTSAARLRRRYRIPLDAPVIGFVGRLVPDKGIAELDSAWQRLRQRFPALHLLLIGETEEHDPLPLPLAWRLKRDPRVSLTGWQEAMPQHYSLMDVCVLPSRREGLPYAAIEASAMAKPVVAFAVSGVVDAIEDGVTGLLAPPGDSQALAAAVARLLSDADLRRCLGDAGRARALRLYRQEPLWEFIHQQYLSVLSSPVSLWWKRPLDLAAAVLLLVLLAPLIAAVALAVLLDLGPPVLFRQRRPGLREQLFELLKFRTMRNHPGADGDRLTRLGRFLRRTSLDELPQLANILRGEMSFIGPRPLLERYLAFYTPRERRRHLVRPGLTGWAQIHGRNDLAWRERLEMDVWYVEHASWRLDARIALASLWKILTRQGVQDDPSSTMLDLDVERQGA